MNMSAGVESDILAAQAGQFGEPQPRLYRQQQKRVIAPTTPRAQVRCGEQRFNLLARQMAHLIAWATLAGDREDALDLGGMHRCFERGVVEE